MHSDSDAKHPESQDPRKAPPRFLGPFVRLTQPGAMFSDKVVWVRASAIQFSQDYSGELTRARSHVWLGSMALPVIEEPEIVARFASEVADREKHEVHSSGCLTGPEVDTPYSELTMACLDLFDALGIEPPREHAQICEAVRDAAKQIDRMQMDAASGFVLALGAREAEGRSKKSHQEAIERAARLSAGLRAIRLAIDKAGRDVQALFNVEEILESLAGDVVFVDREGNPLAKAEPPARGEVQ